MSFACHKPSIPFAAFKPEINSELKMFKESEEMSLIRRLVIALCMLILVSACGGGGDVNINANDNSTITDNSVSATGGGVNPCASYTIAGSTTTQQGSFDGTNCTYDASFVGCLLYTSPSPRDRQKSRMPSSA